MAQEGAIVQIKHCLILKYEKKCNQVFFKCNISVKKNCNFHRMTPIYKAINMYLLLLPFESLVLFSFSISPILFCSQVIGDEFCSHFCCRLLIFVK